MPGRSIVAFALALFLAGLAGTAAAAPKAGEVLAISGQCFVERGGQKTAIGRNDPVEVGDVVLVPAGARLKLRMNDGSVISAAAGSRVEIKNFATGGQGQPREATLALASGLLRAVVSRVAEPSHFEVQTATGVAAVRSTDWFVEAKPGVTVVGVLKGSVRLSSAATGHSVDIPAGWGARLFSGKDPVPPRRWSHAEFARVIGQTALR
jgi:hypothetical protein